MSPSRSHSFRFQLRPITVQPPFLQDTTKKNVSLPTIYNFSAAYKPLLSHTYLFVVFTITREKNIYIYENYI